LRDGASFAEQARASAFDLTQDESLAQRAQRASQLTWDRKKRKFTRGDGIGADNQKMIKGESGALLPATFNSGRYSSWLAGKKVSVPRVGEQEMVAPRLKRDSHVNEAGVAHKRSNKSNAQASGLLTAHAVRKERLSSERVSTCYKTYSDKPSAADLDEISAVTRMPVRHGISDVTQLILMAFSIRRSI